MAKRSRTEYSMINMMVGFAGYIINTIMGFVCRMVFVRSLPEAYLGINGLFGNILSMLSLAELGIGTAIVYALYKPLAEDDEEKIASLMQFYGKAYRVIGCIIGIIGLALIPGLKYLIKETPNIRENIYLIYVIFLFNTCLTYFFSYRASLLVAAQRNYIQLGLSNLISTVQSIIQIIVLLRTQNYLLYLGIQTVGTFTFNVLISRKAIHDYPYIKRKYINPIKDTEKNTLFKNVKAITVSRISELLVNSTDNIIISYFSGLVAVGLASNYTLFTDTLGRITSQIFNSLTSSVGNLNATEDSEKRYCFFKALQLFSFLIYGWACIGICFVISDLVELCFGKTYVLAASIPFVFALNFYLLGMNISVTVYRSTLGLFRYGQYLLCFTAAINLILSFVLGKWLGLFGIYLATAIARLLTTVWYMPLVVFKYGLKRNPVEYYCKYIKYFVIFVFDGAVCYLICRLVNFSILANVLVKVIICSIVPNAVAYVLFRKTDEWNYLYSTMVRIFTRVLKIKNKRG